MLVERAIMVNAQAPGDFISPVNSPEKDIATRTKCKLLCMKHLPKFLPILTWLPKYTLHNLQCDFIAGVTVGLMVIPQALAYASIARLPAQYGLYSSFMGCFVYFLFGTAKDVTLGPTAILSLMVATYSIPKFATMAVTFSLLVGVILLAMGIFHLGFLVRFVSIPVISGFTSAAAITIALGQLKDLTGLHKLPRSFFGNLIKTLGQIKDWNWYDFLFGVLCIFILLLMRLLSRIKTSGDFTITQLVFRKFCWLIGTGRNAIVVIMSMVVIYVLGMYDKDDLFTLTEDITPGLPPFELPEFTMNRRDGNTTTTYHFLDILDQYSSGLAVVPLLAFMEAIAIGKAFSRINNYKIRPTQELIALGIANIMGSFVSAYPVTGSFSRTAVNSQSGVKTPAAGLVTGTIVILAIKFLTNIFQYIPRACLGAVIISAVLPMVDIKIVKHMWYVKRLDLIPYLITFLGCFYTLEFGLIAGIISSLCFVLYPVLKPDVDIKLKEISVVYVHDGLYYPGIEHIVEKVEEAIRRPDPPIAVILDMCGVTHLDYTVVKELSQLVSEVRVVSPGTDLLATNVREDVRAVLEKGNLSGIITSPENVSERLEEGQRLLAD